MHRKILRGTRMRDKDDKHVYIMVPRKLVIAVLTAFVVLFIGLLASFQYANYVDRRSNKVWCGIVVLFDDTYKKSPPTFDTGKILAKEFVRIRQDFTC
jgi:hypothetical protein